MKIKNWNEFQHFKDRTPPWIKLHRTLLERRDINMISDRSFRVLVGLWLLASEDKAMEGNLPSIDEISFRLRIDKDSINNAIEELVGFIESDDITTISKQHQTSIPETEVEIEVETDKKNTTSKNKFSDEDMTNAEYIFSRIQLLNPNHKQPNLESWANEIRKIREIDKKTTEEIKELFTWANSDSFWQENILSPLKLRKQWDRLFIQKNNGVNSGKNQQDSRGSTKKVADKLNEIARKDIKENGFTEKLGSGHI